MSQKLNKEADSTNCNILGKNKSSSIIAIKIENEKANNSLIKSNNSISQSSDQKEKQNNSLIKSKVSISKKIDLKEKPLISILLQ